MHHVLWEIISYMIFLYLLMMVAYSNRDTTFHNIYKHYANMLKRGSYDGSKTWDYWNLYHVS